MGRPTWTRWSATAVFAGLLAHGADAWAKGDGFDEQTVRVGMSTVLSGPAAGLGQEMKRGVDMYFTYVNGQGGVHGRRLELQALDDGYEPARTAPNMRRLINEHDVFAVVGNVGTPTAVVSVPIANEEKVPLFGALTGASILRLHPPQRYILNFRASYNQEMKAMVDGLVDGVGIPPERIAFFTQNDAYGDAGYSGAVKALRARGYEDVIRNVHGRYQRNTVNVEGGLARILEARVEPLAVIMVGTYKACAKFVRLAERERFRALFLNLSFVGAEAFAAALEGTAEGRVIITQVVPSPRSRLPAVAGYRKELSRTGPTFNSLEGWLAARAFVEVLERTGPELSRERFVDAFEAVQGLDLGLGVKHSMSATQHQVSHKVWPTVLAKGAWSSFEWPALKRRLGRRLAVLTRKGQRR